MRVRSSMSIPRYAKDGKQTGIKGLLSKKGCQRSFEMVDLDTNRY
jgi:hypothetical protein